MSFKSRDLIVALAPEEGGNCAGCTNTKPGCGACTQTRPGCGGCTATRDGNLCTITTTTTESFEEGKTPCGPLSLLRQQLRESLAGTDR